METARLIIPEGIGTQLWIPRIPGSDRYPSTPIAKHLHEDRALFRLLVVERRVASVSELAEELRARGVESNENKLRQVQLPRMLSLHLVPVVQHTGKGGTERGTGLATWHDQVIAELKRAEGRAAQVEAAAGGMLSGEERCERPECSLCRDAQRLREFLADISAERSALAEEICDTLKLTDSSDVRAIVSHGRINGTPFGSASSGKRTGYWLMAPGSPDIAMQAKRLQFRARAIRSGKDPLSRAALLWWGQDHPLYARVIQGFDRRRAWSEREAEMQAERQRQRAEEIRHEKRFVLTMAQDVIRDHYETYQKRSQLIANHRSGRAPLDPVGLRLVYDMMHIESLVTQGFCRENAEHPVPNWVPARMVRARKGAGKKAKGSRR